jgi:hypothetical protein
MLRALPTIGMLVLGIGALPHVGHAHLVRSAVPEFPRVKRPFSRFTPSVAADLASVLTSAIVVLESWRLPVRVHGRLRRAEQCLREVADQGRIPDDPLGLRRVASAARLAVDFYHIATSLSPTPVDSMAAELAKAIGGSLNGDSKDTSAYEYQSQFWVGMLLAQSLLRPAVVPSREGPQPDFIVNVDGLPLALEVKRPSAVKTVKRVLGAAADQLRVQREPGIIVLDLSAALAVDALVLPQRGVNARDVITERHKQLSIHLNAFVERYERSEKFNRVLALVTFARFWVWESATPPTSDIGHVFTLHVYPDACSGLLVRQSTRLQEKLQRGIRSVTDGRVRTSRH